MGIPTGGKYNKSLVGVRCNIKIKHCRSKREANSTQRSWQYSLFDLCGNEDNHCDRGTLLGRKCQRGTKGVESQGGGQEQISLAGFDK